MSDARGRLCCLLWVWQMSMHATLLIPGGMQGVLPCSSGKVNADAHSTIDAQRHMVGALPYLSSMGVNGAHNTIGENVAAYNTAWVLSCQEGRRVLPGRCTGYGPWYYGLTLCALSYFLRPFPGPYRAGVPGRLAPVGTDCASRKGACK